LKCPLDDDSSESEDDTKSKKSKRALNDDEFEEVPIDQRMFFLNIYFFDSILSFFFLSAMKRIHLDAEDLALGHVMAQSKSNREQLIDHSYNRYEI